MLKLFCYCLLLASVASLNAAEEVGHSTDEDDTPKTEEEVVVSHHVHGTGAREDLDPTLEALKNMAYLFLPLSLDFVQVKEAHREIVDGVKFELIVETKDNENKPVICQIFVKERPWIAKHDKPRELEYSNCSVSQPVDLEAINKKYPDNTIFNIDASYGGDLSELEGQIMPPRKPTQKPPVHTIEVSELEFSPLATSLPVPSTTPKENNEIQKLPEEGELSQHAQSALDDLFIYNLPNVNPTLEKDTVNTDAVSEEPYVEVRVTPKVNPIETPVQETENEDTEGQLIFTNLEVQKQLDALFNIQTSNYDHAEGFSSYNTDDVQEPLAEKVETTTKICPPQIQNFGVYHHAVDAEHQFPQNNDFYLNNIEFNKRKRQAEETDAFVHDLAERVLEQLDHVDSDSYKRILINVLNHRVIRNRYGQIYYISLLYGNTRCNEDSSSTVDCMSSLIENSNKICNVEVEVSVDTGATKLTKSGCAPVGRSKRGDHLVGAPVEVTNEDDIESARKLAEESLASYSAAGDGRNYRLVKVSKVTMQVVAGTLYKMDAVVATSEDTQADCHMEIWDQPWIKENGKQLTLKCGEEREITHTYSRKKRSERPLGAPEEVTDNESLAKIKSIAEESLASYSASGDGRTYSLKSITKVTSQVVAGMLYKMDAVVATSGNTEAKCHLEIWDRPWVKENGKQLKLKCDEEQEVTHKYSRKRRSERPPGAPEEVTDSESLAKIKSIAEESLASYSASGDGRTYSLKSITKVTSQVVAGMLYKMDAVVATSGNTEAKCHLEIWDRPWVKENGKQLRLKCDEEQEVTHKYSRKRRSERPPGAPEEVTDSESLAEIKRIAEESLASYSAAGDGRTYSLKSITKVTSQVVAGMLYKMDAVVATSGNTEAKCHMEIWDRPWVKENGKQLKLKCDEEQEVTHKYSRKRRSERPRGAPEEVTDSESLAEIKRIAEESLASYSAAGDGRTYSLKSISKVTSQVVAGMLYKMDAVVATSGNTEAKCHMEIWDRPWVKENGKQLKLKCDEEQEVTHKYSRKRRSERPLGAPEEVTDSESLADIKRIAEESLVSYSAAGDGRTYSLKKITKVTSQVVAGMLYKIDAVVETSGNTEAKCHLEIWDRPWVKENGKQLKLKCDEEQEVTHKYSRKRRSEESVNGNVIRKKRMRGSPEQVTDENELSEIKSLAEKSLKSYSDAGDGQTFKLKNIWDVSSQVVAGFLYKMKSTVETNDGEVECDMEIWTREWIKDKGTQITMKCNNQEPIVHRYRRSMKDVSSINGNRPLRKNSYHLFNKFLYKYKKTYPTRREEKLRYKIFRKNLHLIDQLNALEQGTGVYGVTEFADMTPEEYQSRTGLIPRSDDANHIRNPIAEIPDIELPKEFDWRKKNVISEVKNQGSCGSCWAFSVTGNIEGLHAIRTGKLEEYSEQELLDCDTVDNACNGGLPDDAYKAIEKLGGLELESEYPYEARKDQCKFNSSRVHVRVKGAVDLPPDENAMAKWLVANGPISIGINANAMQFYRGGISHPWRLLCRKGGVDHGVLIVGYGVADYPVFNKTIPYWIVKNSWGRSWGEQGYYRVYRGDNTCGINSMASSAVLSD